MVSSLLKKIRVGVALYTIYNESGKAVSGESRAGYVNVLHSYRAATSRIILALFYPRFTS